MKFFLALLAVAFCHEMLITEDFIEELKHTVDWEVEDYENSIFRGWTMEEAQSLFGYLGEGESFETEADDEPVEPVDNIDWSKDKCDHGPMSQGQCGSCWAFAIVGMMSYRCCKATGDKGWLSPQELVSCDRRNFGCRGGFIETPMYYIRENHGLVKETCFPYVARNTPCTKRCKDGKDWKSAHICNCVKYKRCHGVRGMKDCLASGPATFGFRVERSFMVYKDGIYKCHGGPIVGGHAVLAMGLFEKPECHYYTKNSWGHNWGLKGYFKFACGTCRMDGGVACTKF